MTPQETFVARLRRHRYRNQIALDEIAASTRVQRELLEAFEKNDLSAWPRGLYSRAWVRGYAAMVGLDPADTVEEFCRLFPQGDRRASGTIRDMAAIVAAPSEYRDEIPHEDRRSGGPPAINMMPAVPWHTALLQAGRALLVRIAGTKPAPSFRERRAPRTM